MAEQKVKRFAKRSRIFAIVAGVLLAILGIVFFAFPLKSMLFVDIFITIGLLIFGIYLIIVFIAGPKGFRNGWDLALGAVFVICSALILASNASNIIVSFAFLLGFLALMVGLNQIVSYSALRGLPGAGFALAAGIINILLALFILFAPFMGTAVLGIVQGVYLVVTGVTLIIEGISKRSAAFFDSLEE